MLAVCLVADQCHKTYAVLPLRVFADHASPTGLIMLLLSCEPSQTVQGRVAHLLTGVASENSIRRSGGGNRIRT